MKKRILSIITIVIFIILIMIIKNNMRIRHVHDGYIPDANFEELEETNTPISEDTNKIDRTSIKYETKITHDYPVLSKTVKLESIDDFNDYEFKDSLKDTFIEEELNNNKIIFISQHELSSGSTKISISDAYTKNNKLYATLKMEYPEIGTCDMAAAFYIFSCEKNVTDVVFK